MVDPDGAGKEPLLIVGGTRESRGVVCSASYEARKFGVRSAMPIARALRLCPAAMCVPVPRKACGEKSREIRAVLERFAPIVEGASIDEWYMDLGGTEGLYHDEPLADDRAADARQRRRRDGALGVDRRRNDEARRQARRRAREAEARHRRDRRARRRAGDEAAFLETFELADIPMVGPRFQERLARLGMRRVPDVLQYDVATLTQWLGEREASWLYDRVRGIDSGDVEAHGDAKSISRDDTFPRDINDDDELGARAARARHARRARSSRRRPDRAHDHRSHSRSSTSRRGRRTAPSSMPVMSDRVILEVARALLAKLRARAACRPGCSASSLSSLAVDSTADQLDLFEQRDRRTDETERDRQLARTIDRVREKFGDKGFFPPADRLARVAEVRSLRSLCDVGLA